MAKVLMKGNEAFAESCLRAGCRFFSGYPITPQTEILEYMSWRMEQVGGQFIQTESELAGINMLFGAACCGARALTTSAGPGFSLKQEGISYMAGSHIPAVIVNMERGGPGLGDIGPSQGDYFQAVKGGGHGDHRNLVLAPSTAQECYDMMFRAFALAFKYANPVMLLGDAIVAQIKEPVRRQPPADALSPEALAELAAPWRMEGYGKRGPGAKPRLLKSVYLAEGALAARNRLLMEKYAAMQAEACAECWNTDDAELVVVAFGSMARIARSAIRKLREEGLKAGLFRPKTLYPFPADALRALAPGRRFLVIEQNTGQMVEDVRLSLMGENARVDWHGVMPGLFIGADALEDPIRQACKEN